MNICIYKHKPTVDVTLKILDAYHRAFEKEGHSVLILSQDMDGYSPRQAREIASRFLNHKSDMAICYGFAAMPEMNDGYFFRSHGIPLTILCFENPFFGLNNKLIDEIKRYPDYYRFFVWDPYYLDLLKQYCKNCYPILHAAEIAEFQASVPVFERKLAFVGHISDFNQLRAERTKAGDHVDNLIDQVMLQKMHNPVLNIFDLITDISERIPGYKANDSRFLKTDIFLHKHVIYPLYSEGLGKYRYYLLNQLSEFQVDYYGDVNWTAPHITFHPPVSYFEELPTIYRSTIVNLDIPPFQSIHSLNNRFFDIGAAKALLLTEAKSDLRLIFDDVELICYRSLDELKEKITFYLKNIDVRNQVAEKLHQCILKSHTYEHRVRYMIEAIS